MYTKYLSFQHVSLTIAALVVLLGVIFMPVRATHAQSDEISEILAEIAAVIAEIIEIRQEYGEDLDPLCEPWPRNLGVGDEGEDVLELQRFLNSRNLTVANEGDGSPGNETNYYGQKTADTVELFQERHRKEVLIPNDMTSGNGFFGASTRAKATEIYCEQQEREKAREERTQDNDKDDDDKDTDVDKDDARELIDEADDDIDDAEEEIKEAEDDDIDVDDAEDILDDAKEELDKAEEAYDDRDYEEAAEHAEEAIELAEEALDELEEDKDNDDDDEDKDDNERADDVDINSFGIDGRTVTLEIEFDRDGLMDNVDVDGCESAVFGTIAWGDGEDDDIELPGCGNQDTIELGHTYDDDGTYAIEVEDMDNNTAKITIEIDG